MFSYLQNCILEVHWGGLCSAGGLAGGWGRIWGQAGAVCVLGEVVLLSQVRRLPR